MKADKALKLQRDLRRANLNHLLARYKNASALSTALGYSSRATISALLTGQRHITEGTARKIEEKLKLPAGWLDAKHTGGGGK